MINDPHFLPAIMVVGAVTGGLMLLWHLWNNREDYEGLVSAPQQLSKCQPVSWKHRQAVLQQVVTPSAISITWQDVAGLDDLIAQIKRQVIYPMRSVGLGRDPLMLPPKGVLLYGPPGCGKTLVAKAIAKEINAVFINFDVSSIKNKFVGETEKMTSALFWVADVMQPSIIFVDEADAFLGTRQDTDHGTDATMKALFLTMWDGLTTDINARVLVLAATNRRDAIDHAILRRLPLQFEFPLPSMEQRAQILATTLRHSRLASDVDLYLIAERCEGFSGSDLYELCRYAAITRLVQLSEGSTTASLKEERSLRPLNMSDFMDAIDNARDITRISKPPSHLYM